jgi:hypothetical protein
MPDKTISATRIRSLDDTTGEKCELTVSASKLVVLVEGPLTLQCFPVDEIEAVMTSVVEVQQTIQESIKGLLVIRTLEGSADVALLLEDIDECRSTVDEIHAMRRTRQARGVSVPKMIDVYYPGTNALRKTLAPEGTSIVKWSKGSTAPMPPFPHSRLDFLRLHLNKSVMQKVTSFGDLSIELSCDHVTATGSLVGSASSTAPASIDEVEHRLQELSMEGLVLLLTDKSLYLTKPSGVLVVRCCLAEVVAMRAIEHRDAVVAFSTGKWLSLRSKYCNELIQRVRSQIAVPVVSALRALPVEHQTTSMQTDEGYTMHDVAPSIFRLQLRVKELEEQLNERNAMIAVLRKRNDVGDKSIKQAKGAALRSRDVQEVDILRHYILLLEVECDRLQQDRGVHEDDGLVDCENPKEALAHAKMRHTKLESTNQRLMTELEEMSRSFHRSLEEASSKALCVAKTFVRTLEKRWQSDKRSVQISFPPQGAQTKRLREINAKLIEELKDRDRLVEELMRSEDPKVVFPKHLGERLRKVEEASAAIDELESNVLAATQFLGTLRDNISSEVLAQDAAKADVHISAKLASALGSLSLQAGRVANLEVMLLQSTQRKLEYLQLTEKVRALEKENSLLRAHQSRRPTANKAAHRPGSPSPRPRTHTDTSTNDAGQSHVVSLSPNMDDPTRLHDEFEAQRRAFERRLQDLEMIAFTQSPSPAAMGVVHTKLESDTPQRQAAVIEAQKILLRSHSPRHRDLLRSARVL